MAGLGKGLSALISEDTIKTVQSGNGYIPNLPINKIVANPYQPRVEFEPEKLVELADSIREHGVIEPLLVTKKDAHTYELIAGERRWRAAQLAGLEHIAVVVKEASPQDMLELAVIENIQRQDLNPLEEAMAFEQLAKVFNLTHQDIAKKVGLSRPAIANKVRLLSLPEEVKRGLLENKISEGHARALLGIESPEKLMATYQLIVRDHLSVRAVEELVRRINQNEVKHPTPKTPLDARTKELQTKLQTNFGKHVVITKGNKGGKVTFAYSNESELDQLVFKLLK